jgi:hypothetical protein
MTPAEFARERCGIGEMPGAQGVGPISPDAWGSLVDRGSSFVGPFVLGVDVAPDGVSAALGAVGRREDGMTHVGMVDRQDGTAWLEQAIREAIAYRRPEALAYDAGGPAAAFTPEILRAAGDVPVVKIAGREYAAACEAFAAAANADRLRHLGTAWLASAVGGAAKRSTGDGWVWNRRDPRCDVSPLVAVTVALRAFEQLPAAEFFAY